MSQIWLPQPKEVLKHWISSCLVPSVRDKLSPWEEKFICSLDWQLEKRSLSKLQQDTLERIYTEKTS